MASADSDKKVVNNFSENAIDLNKIEDEVTKHDHSDARFKMAIRFA